MSSSVIDLYNQVLDKCKVIFIEKLNLYGPSWIIMRPSTIADLILIKASRIRTIEDKKTQMIPEDILSEWIAIVNYAIIGLILLKENFDKNNLSDIIRAYDKVSNEIKELFNAKNHDYGGIWQEMDLTSFTDIVISRVYRQKELLKKSGNSSIRELLKNNLFDIANYGIFYLIRAK